MKYLFILISLSSFAQLREPVQQIIFPKDSTIGRIEIYSDSLSAFGITWSILTQNVQTWGDRIENGAMLAKYKEQRLILLVRGKRLTIDLPGIKRVRSEQLPHSLQLYAILP